MRKVAITTQYITLSAFLKFCGGADSGGQASGLVTDGQVSVNGEICRQRGRKLVAGDVVTLGSRQYEVSNPCI